MFLYLNVIWYAWLWNFQSFLYNTEKEAIPAVPEKHLTIWEEQDDPDSVDCNTHLDVGGPRYILLDNRDIRTEIELQISLRLLQMEGIDW